MSRRPFPVSRRAGLLLSVALLAGFVPSPGFTQAVNQAADPPYEQQLLRLAEILGALHYLRPLCRPGEGSVWREQMAALIDAEEPGEARRSRLIDRFNLGFSSFSAVHRNCTSAAATIADRYQREAAQISRDITARYGR